MAALIRYLFGVYTKYFVETIDPRASSLPLMSSCPQIILLLVGYNLFVLKIGPSFMKNRRAMDLKTPMILYNLTQIIFNSFIFVQSLRLIWLPMRYSLICEEVDYRDEPFPNKVLFYTWMVFMSKILDLLDTVFMVLRKKNNQISFLHIYHHTAMVWAGWIATKYVGGGHIAFFGTVNTFVHAVMYSYYLITALKPEYKKNIWWKRHITEMQMVQFVVTGLHSFINLVNPYCNFPKLLLVLFLPQDWFMFLMFWDFYKKAYLSKKPQTVTTGSAVNGEAVSNGEVKTETMKKSD